MANRESLIRYAVSTPDLTIDGPLKIPAYELEADKMHIHDVVWGDETIGDDEYDDLLMQLARHPLFTRLQAVEQLTLPPQYSTIPNTSGFSRWQHIWGSLVFARKMTKGDTRFSERDRIVQQLRTLFSDVGQTAFSHLGDWIFQDNTGAEDLHDQELRGLLESFDIDTMLDRYGLSLDETVFPDTEDWIECPSPNLCVDRVDYGMREILRWMSASPLHLRSHQLRNPQSIFRINDEQMLEMTDERFARHFAAAYNLLPTEHWAQPVHRLQLELMQGGVKRALLDNRHTRAGVSHPRHVMYDLDASFRFDFQSWEGITLSDTMKSVGLSERNIYVTARQHDIQPTLRAEESTLIFPEPITPYSWQSERYGLVSPQIELEEVGSTNRAIELGRYGIRVGLPPLKMRSVDPLVWNGTDSAPLSDIDQDFNRYCMDQQAAMSRSYEALLLMNSSTAKRVHDMFLWADERWQEAINQPKDADGLKRMVTMAALFATQYRFDTVVDHERYNRWPYQEMDEASELKR